MVISAAREALIWDTCGSPPQVARLVCSDKGSCAEAANFTACMEQHHKIRSLAFLRFLPPTITACVKQQDMIRPLALLRWIHKRASLGLRALLV